MDLSPKPRRFATTHWSLVLAARSANAADAAAALATLCDTYWHPVFAFIRRTGKSPEDAADLTQAFFARVIEKKYFQAVDQSRGRFRTFLLTAVQHFLANAHDARTAVKRGGRFIHVSWAHETDDGPLVREPVEFDTPEHVYERRWAKAAFESALVRLSRRHEHASRRAQFERLRPYLTGDELTSYADLAAELGIAEGALRVAVHRLRNRFAKTLREVIRETVTRPEDVDDELRYLLAVLARRRA